MKKLCVALVVAVAGFLAPGLALAQSVIPVTGVDVGAFAEEAIASLGVVVLVIVGGFFAFKLIKLALRWVGRMAG